MGNTNIIFGRKTVAVKPQITNQKTTISKPRKKRSDAKHDIKFKLSSTDKKQLHFKALEHDLKITPFASMIVEKDLLIDREYQSFDYDNDGEFVHVVLDGDFFKMIQRRSVEWNLSYRRTVHRIIKEYLHRVNTGLTIYHHAGGVVQ